MRHTNCVNSLPTIQCTLNGCPVVLCQERHNWHHNFTQEFIKGAPARRRALRWPTLAEWLIVCHQPIQQKNCEYPCPSRCSCNKIEGNYYDLNYTMFVFSLSSWTYSGTKISGMFHLHKTGCNSHVPVHENCDIQHVYVITPLRVQYPIYKHRARGP